MAAVAAHTAASKRETISNSITKMHAIRIMGAALLLAGILPGMAASVEPAGPLSALSTSGLEQRLVSIDSELAKLASYSLLSGVGSVGFRTAAHKECAHAEWIQIDFGQEETIDQVILVPAIWRDTRSGFQADGFPLEFRIVVGTGQDDKGTVVASFGKQHRLLPRISPVVASFPATRASWVRVEASVLTPRAWDGLCIFQLSEIFVFGGEENVALQKPVKTSSPEHNEGGARDKQFLVDGFVPYLMDAAQGDQSLAFLSEGDIGEQPALTIDLGTSQPVNRIHLHALDLSDTVPQSTPADFGTPRRLVVEGANLPDFSDAVRLNEYRMESIYEAGPIIMRRFPETSCRYVRLTAVEPFINSLGEISRSQIGFAEIEVFSNGRNVALGTSVQANFAVKDPERPLLALTDGRNLYGQILPVRAWLGELARRHDLEAERPLVLAELGQRYARQKTNLKRMGWLATLLAGGIIFIILIDRIIRMRHVSRIRERLAADLHDELGASIHTIGLLSDLADDARGTPQELATLHRRIRAETERSGAAVRHCTDMLQADGLYSDLLADMQRASNRIMAKLKHDISIEGQEFLNQLKPRTRADLFLFYKECLVNISRHSEATRFTTHLTANRRGIHLRISDNGRGLAQSGETGVPSSIKRRARLLGAKVTVDSPATGGTCIDLKLRTRRWGIRK
jgi:signal transduction histidine kinase